MSQCLLAAFVSHSSKIGDHFLDLFIRHLRVAFNETNKWSGKEVKCSISTSY